MPETIETPIEPNEFIEGTNREIDKTFIEHNPNIIEGDISDADKQQLADDGVVFHNGSAELKGADILTAADRIGNGTIADPDSQTVGMDRPIIETTTSATPHAPALRSVVPPLESEKDETAGSFATSEQQSSTELDNTDEHIDTPVLDPTSGSL